MAVATRSVTADQADAPRRRLGARGTITAARVLVALVVVGGWELAARLTVLDPFFFSQPSDVARLLREWLVSGEILDDLVVTVGEAFGALLIGTILGLITGFLLARSPFLDAVFAPYVKLLNAVPRVVLAPIFLLWFGLGEASKVAFGVSLVFFVVFFNTYQGVREVDRVLVDSVRMLGANERQLARHVLVPSALAWIFSGLRVSIGFAIVGAVVGEYLGASRGVGYVIAQAQGVFDTTGVFAGIVLLSVVVGLIDVVVHRLERHLLRWKPERTQGFQPS
ncbi:ABC transporter permease [Longimycelium tulufanense]|uniref:ABC transporter permease n=1 Tax=Longimycelium tulufanense TaxID=907463 RepID=A0A8J3CBM5_9PSEU|nr:ABC transporter permease [Longimycelium tulufanense]GGM70598.1 ABC transporter permease [Longimycelium tulufanense]